MNEKGRSKIHFFDNHNDNGSELMLTVGSRFGFRLPE